MILEEHKEKVIDGNLIALSLRARLKDKVSHLRQTYGIVPGLAVVLVGDDPASRIYVKNKGKQSKEIGFNSMEHRLSSSVSESELLNLVDDLNASAEVNGILVQLPLPSQIDSSKVLNRIDPSKDVDGFHPINIGRLWSGESSLAPCTPYGCMFMLKQVLGDIKGLTAVVLGRSNIVGKPMAAMLLKHHATVSIAHSRTKDLASVCRGADILVAAVGRALMVKGDWIKPGSCVIDVGINRIEDSSGKRKLVGDVDFDKAILRAKHITPVPGGVGPMTIACLLLNTVTATLRQNNLEIDLI